MLLFLLTAREGRLSANHLGCPSSRNSRCGPVRRSPAPTHSCVSRSRPATFLTTKPAISRVFYVGTNMVGHQTAVQGSPKARLHTRCKRTRHSCCSRRATRKPKRRRCGEKSVEIARSCPPRAFRNALFPGEIGPVTPARRLTEGTQCSRQRRPLRHFNSLPVHAQQL